MYQWRCNLLQLMFSSRNQRPVVSAKIIQPQSTNLEPILNVENKAWSSTEMTTMSTKIPNLREQLRKKSCNDTESRHSKDSKHSRFSKRSLLYGGGVFQKLSNQNLIFEKEKKEKESELNSLKLNYERILARRHHLQQKLISKKKQQLSQTKKLRTHLKLVFC